MNQALVLAGAAYLRSMLVEDLLRRGYRVMMFDDLSCDQVGPIHLCAEI